MTKKISILVLLLMFAGIGASAGETLVTLQGNKGTISSDKKTFTTSATAGVAGIVITANEISTISSTFNVSWGLQFKAAQKNVEESVTVTVPEGYLIKDYTVSFQSMNARTSYDVTIGGVTKQATNNTNANVSFSADNLNATSMSFVIKCLNTGGTVANLLVKSWKMTLVQATSTVDVTFKVNDADGNELDSRVYPFLDGDVVSELPAEMKYPYVSYAYGNPLTVTGGGTNVFTCTAGFDDLPFEPFVDYDHAAWYMMSINSEAPKYVVASTTTPWPTTGVSQTTGAEGLWAFKGNPYTGIEVYNKAAGSNQTLKPNGTTTGSAITMQGGETYKWTIKLGNMGFMLGNGTTFAQDYNGSFAIVNETNVNKTPSSLMLTPAPDTDYTTAVNRDILPWIESIGTGYFTLDPSVEAVTHFRNAYYSHDASSPWLWGQYQDLLGRLNSAKSDGAFIKPEAGKFYRIKSSRSHIATQPYLVGENYGQVGGTMRGKLSQNAADEAGSIWYYDGTSLVNYSNGLYAVSNGANGFCMATAPVASGLPIVFERAIGVEKPGECNIRLNNTYYYLTSHSDFYTDIENHNYNASSNFVLEAVEELPVTLKKSGEKYYATFYSPVAIENFNITAGKIVNAYKVVSLSNDRVLLDLLDNSGAPANCGVLLVSDGDGSSTMKVTASIGLYYGSETTTGLNGVTASEPASAHSSNYFFGQSKGVLGFWKMKANGATGGFKAYIGRTVFGGAKEGFGLFTDDVTGIEKLTPVGERSDAWFDLGGRQMGNGKSPKGVYIKNGKKYVPTH